MTLILVVDDEPGIRGSACLALEEAGFQTVAAASANEAKAVIGLTVPDIIVMDIRLPDTSGLDLAIRLQPTYPKIPVLFISAWMERLPPDVSLAPLHQAFSPSRIPTTPWSRRFAFCWPPAHGSEGARARSSAWPV